MGTNPGTVATFSNDPTVAFERDMTELLRKLVPEEGIEPSRGVNPTGF